MDDQYAELDNEGFDQRLHTKLMACTPATLTRYLLDFAYEDISEEFNNEILSDWEADREAEADDAT